MEDVWDEAEEEGMKGGCQNRMRQSSSDPDLYEIFLEVRWHDIHRKTYSSLHSAGHIVSAGWLAEGCVDEQISGWIMIPPNCWGLNMYCNFSSFSHLPPVRGQCKIKQGWNWQTMKQ